MEFISTTATATEKLKRLAKTLRKTTGTSLAVALDAVAKQHGYEHWKHVTVCLDQSVSASRSKPLPESLKDLLGRAATRKPASVDSREGLRPRVCLRAGRQGCGRALPDIRVR